MAANRRSWLKQMGFGLAGIGTANIPVFAGTPVFDLFEEPGKLPVFLSSNENPYGPSPMARKIIAENLGASNRYNWEIASTLIARLAQKEKLSDAHILLGTGSTEILDLVARLASGRPGNYVVAHPTYNYWMVNLDRAGLQRIKVPLDANKKLDLKSMAAAVNNDTRLIYICNPNNPSGTMWDRQVLVDFISALPKDVLVLVDEAYIDFTTQPSLADLVSTMPNLVIAKTFSKIYGLAGARVGYAIGDPKTIDRLAYLQSSPNGGNSVLSRLAALASLDDHEFLKKTSELNQSNRNLVLHALNKMELRTAESHTNFLYFSLNNYKGDYFKRLKEANIHGTSLYEEDGKWTRITIGTAQEMKRFLEAIQ